MEPPTGRIGADMKLIVGVVVAVVLVIAVVAATGALGPRPGSSYRSATVTLEDLRFTPNRIDAKVGVPITVRIAYRGTERHDLNFPSLHMARLEGIEAILEPGESSTVTLTFDPAGTHTFICTLPGHAAAGMTGAVYVTS